MEKVKAGTKITTKTKEPDKSFQDNLIDLALSSHLDLNYLENLNSSQNTRNQKYKLYEVMSKDARIKSIINVMVDDICSTDSDGNNLFVTSNNQNAVQYINFLLKKLNIENLLPKLARNLIVYGNYYLKLYKNSDIVSTFEESTGRKSLNETVNIVPNLKSDKYSYYVELQSDPASFFELSQFGKTVGFVESSSIADFSYNDIWSFNSSNNGDVKLYDASCFIHGKIDLGTDRHPEKITISNDKNDTQYVYTVETGTSELEDKYSSWRELSLLENAILLSRTTKSSVTRIISVQTGNMPKSQVANTLARIKALVEQKSSINTGDAMSEYTNPGAIENNIYIPVRENGIGGISSSNIGGDYDPKQLTDLDASLNKFYGSWGIPKAYFGLTDDGAGFNGGTSLSIISSVYAKKIKNYKKIIADTLETLCNLYCINYGLTEYVNAFSIKMLPPTTQEDKDRVEATKNTIDSNSSIISELSNVITDDILKAKLVKAVYANSGCVNSDALSVLQEQIDMLEEEKEEKNKPEEINTGESEDFEEPDENAESGYEPEHKEEELPDLSGLEPSLNSEETEETSDESMPEISNEEESGMEESLKEPILPSFADLGINGFKIK